MTEKAFNIYCGRLEEQSNRNQARHIRKNVAEARKGREAAAQRWPFELLQNAIDPGPRSGKEFVDVTLRQTESTIVFEHDGAPFTSSELAALLSGGSSKDFESEVTTGRFGSGFLATHVLAEHTTFRGILNLDPGYEQFELHLDRGGDEDRILANIVACKEAIRNAVAIDSIDAIPSP